MKFFLSIIGKKIQNSQNSNKPFQKEGHVSFSKGNSKKNKSTSKVGEYVDFEEVDE